MVIDKGSPGSSPWASAKDFSSRISSLRVGDIIRPDER